MWLERMKDVELPKGNQLEEATVNVIVRDHC